MYIYIYIYIHTYISAYIHTYVHTYVRTYTLYLIIAYYIHMIPLGLKGYMGALVDHAPRATGWPTPYLRLLW